MPTRAKPRSFCAGSCASSLRLPESFPDCLEGPCQSQRTPACTRTLGHGLQCEPWRFPESIALTAQGASCVAARTQIARLWLLIGAGHLRRAYRGRLVAMRSRDRCRQGGRYAGLEKRRQIRGYLAPATEEKRRRRLGCSTPKTKAAGSLPPHGLATSAALFSLDRSFLRGQLNSAQTAIRARINEKSFLFVDFCLNINVFWSSGLKCFAMGSLAFLLFLLQCC